MTRSPLHTRSRHLLAVLGCAAALAACGTSGVAGTGTLTDAARAGNGPLALARCMRANGVPNFPDPTGGGLSITATPGGNTLTVNGVTLSGPAFQAARRACARYLPGGGHGPQLSAAQRERLLRFSECMRTHGVPNFPDPQFPKGGGATLGAPAPGAGSAIDRSSPAFERAQNACAGPGGPRIGPVHG